MKIGEKIALYKERLGHKNYQDFGKAANISGNWLLETSKREDIKVVDITNLSGLARYLNVTIDYLLDDTNEVESELTELDLDSNDIGLLINQLKTILDKDEVRIDGVLLNDYAKQIGKDSLDVVKLVIKQHI